MESKHIPPPLYFASRPLSNPHRVLDDPHPGPPRASRTTGRCSRRWTKNMMNPTGDMQHHEQKESSIPKIFMPEPLWNNLAARIDDPAECRCQTQRIYEQKYVRRSGAPPPKPPTRRSVVRQETRFQKFTILQERPSAPPASHHCPSQYGSRPGSGES